MQTRKSLIYFISYTIIIILIIILNFFLPQATNVSVSPSTKTVSQGQTFDLYISIDPKDTAIAGAQLNIGFNKSIFKINSIKEGNFFNQNGANTFFHNGTINNSLGKVDSIYDVILGSYSVSKPGNFIIINATAIGVPGKSGINLSRVLVSDPNGQTIASNVINGSVNINITARASITVVTPNGGESWVRGTTKTITWTSSGTPGANVKIELLKGGVVNRTINLSTPNDGSYSWTIPTTQATGTNYKLRVTSTTNLAYTDTSNNNFSISTPIPSIIVVSPNGGESWIRGTTKTISWTSSGSPGANVKIELLKGGVLNRIINSSTPNDGSYSWGISSTQTLGTDYKIRITSTTNLAYKDNSNNNFTIRI